jgi:hypothetical protein
MPIWVIAIDVVLYPFDVLDEHFNWMQPAGGWRRSMTNLLGRYFIGISHTSGMPEQF